MTAMEGSLNLPDHQEQPNSGSQSQRWKLWSPERHKYWLLLWGTGALVAVAAVILVLTLGGPGKPRDGTDDSGSSSHFAPAATAVASDFSREISLGGGALTVITSQANGTDGRFFDIEVDERVSAAAAPAEPKPGQPGQLSGNHPAADNLPSDIIYRSIPSGIGGRPSRCDRVELGKLCRATLEFGCGSKPTLNLDDKNPSDGIL